MHTTVDKDLELEGTLPDFCPDIARLIRVDCTPVIESSEINGERCLIVGKVVCNMLYETDYKNKVRNAVFTKDFNHTFDVPMQNCFSPVSDPRAHVNHISCKMLSPRKFVLKPRMQLDLDVFCNTSLKTLDTSSGDNIFYKTTGITYEKKLRPYIEGFEFDEEVPLLQNEKSIGEIVYGSIKLTPPQVSVSGSDVLVKANAVIKAVYEIENSENELAVTTKTIPVSMTLNNLEIGDSSKVSVNLSVADEKITGELDTYGESRIIKAEFTAKAKADITEKVKDVVATDLFSADYSTKTDSISVALQGLASETDRSFSIDTTFNPDIRFESPLHDSDVTLYSVKSEVVPGGIKLTGEYTATIFGTADGNFESYDYTGEFEEMIPIELPENVSSVDTQLYPIDYSMNLLSDGSIALRIVFDANIKAYTEEKQTFISNIISQEPVAKEKEAYSVIYYFPTKADNLWSIAKKYSSNPDTIRTFNPNAFDDSNSIKAGTKMILIKK